MKKGAATPRAWGPPFARGQLPGFPTVSEKGSSLHDSGFETPGHHFP